MGKILKKKKKGRPSKSDLCHRVGRRSRNPFSESEDRRATRHRNLTYGYDFGGDDDDDGDEEDEVEEEVRRKRRKEKKLKLVLRLPNPSRRSINKDEGFSGVDSVTSQSNSEGRQKRKVLDKIYEPSSDYGSNNPSKKRRIYDYPDDEEQEEEEDLIEFRDLKKTRKEKWQNVDSKGIDFEQGFELPDRQQLELILDNLQRKDTYGVFAEPVDPEELPDYHDVIENPMDFGTVRKKLTNGMYSNLEELEDDVLLICSNAMQYNAPETIYYKQASTIHDLTKKKFRRLRISIGRTNEELELEQKTRLHTPIKTPVRTPVNTPVRTPVKTSVRTPVKTSVRTPVKTSVRTPVKKSSSTSVQEPVCSDLSSGATRATVVDTCTLSNPIQPDECEEPNNDEVPSNIEGLVNENSSLTENLPDETEEQLSDKNLPSKTEKKHLVIDENRRATYNISDQLEVFTESILSPFEDESRQLVSVGLQENHSYSRSLARFAATLGRVPWKVASRRIKQALPEGMKFGRGWVGEYEPLSKPILMLADQGKQLADIRIKPEPLNDCRIHDGPKVTQDEISLLRSRNLSALATSPGALNPLKGFPLSRTVSEKKPPLFSVPAKPISHPTNQLQNQLAMNFAKQDNGLKQIEPNPSSNNTNRVDISSGNPLQHDFEMKNSRQAEMASRKVGLAQSVPHMNSDIHRVASGELLNKKSITDTDNNRANNSYGFISNLQARAGTYVQDGNYLQNLNDPNQLRMLAEKAQIQQRPANLPKMVPQQMRVSIPSSRKEDSVAANNAAARAWMSLGATQLQNKPLASSNQTNMQISASSLFNPTRDFSQSVQQFHGVIPPGGLQFQSINRFHPQTPSNESHFQNNKHMVFPQLLSTDLSRFQAQSPWQGFMQNPQTNKKRDMLPPDLNIAFQSSSPVKQSSGILSDSQQPDLALQL